MIIYTTLFFFIILSWKTIAMFTNYLRFNDKQNQNKVSGIFIAKHSFALPQNIKRKKICEDKLQFTTEYETRKKGSALYTGMQIKLF